MCTISIVPHGHDVRVVCNRDERRDRAVALAPAVYRVGRQQALFPMDPDSGGTWIGVNRAGLVVALLNRNPCAGRAGSARRHGSAAQLASRGVIVPLLLQCDCGCDGLARLNRLPPAAFAAFRIVLLEGRSVWTADGGGGVTLQVEQHGVDRPHVFSSSSLGDRVVEEPRRRLFERLISGDRDRWLAGQARFHRHRWQHRPEISVLMSRDDARTVSRTRIDVPGSGRPARMQYEALIDAPERRTAC